MFRSFCVCWSTLCVPRATVQCPCVCSVSLCAWVWWYVCMLYCACESCTRVATSTRVWTAASASPGWRASPTLRHNPPSKSHVSAALHTQAISARKVSTFFVSVQVEMSARFCRHVCGRPWSHESSALCPVCSGRRVWAVRPASACSASMYTTWYWCSDVQCLDLWTLQLKIGTTVTSALGNVHNNLVFFNLF